LFQILRSSPECVLEELNHEVSDDYCYVLNEINRFEKIMKYNGAEQNAKYKDARDSLIKSFKKFRSYMERECSRVSGEGVTHYDVRVESCSGEVDPLSARIELSRDKRKLARDFEEFDIIARRMGIDVNCKDYRSSKDVAESSFDKYYSIVDSALRSKEFSQNP
jgi:hypothetical protein